MPQQIGMLVVMGLTVWLLFIKPQRDEKRRLKELLDGLNKGDKVVTIGGIVGTVVSMKDDYVILRVADRVDIQVKSDAIHEALID